MDRRPNWGSYSCASPKQRYAPVVIRRTIDEFVKAKDTRLIGILKDLLQYPDVYVQVRGIPLWTLESPTLFPFSPNLRRQSQRVEAHSAAHRIIKLLTTSSH